MNPKEKALQGAKTGAQNKAIHAKAKKPQSFTVSGTNSRGDTAGGGKFYDRSKAEAEMKRISGHFSKNIGKDWKFEIK